MAKRVDVVLSRDLARRYSRLSNDYASWAADVKASVLKAGEEDWGTYIAACALLEDIIPQDGNDEVDRRVEFARREAQYREQANQRGHMHPTARRADVVLSRDLARRYSRLSNDYASWAADVKASVRRAGEEDWGTYIAACALLEDVIPQEEKDKVGREVELARREAQHRERASRQSRGRRYVFLFASLLADAVVLLVLAYFAPDVFGMITRANPVLSAAGTVAFSLLGAASAGFALGEREDFFASSGDLGLPLSCIAGFACAATCAVAVPVALVLAWVAWRMRGIARFRQMDGEEIEIPQVGAHGERAYADDPRAPHFVKNAIRLAGIYRDSDDRGGELARTALSGNQSDYGTFIVLDALLSDYHATRQAEAAVQELTGRLGGGGEGASVDNAIKTLPQAEREAIIGRGILVSFAVMISMWLTSGLDVVSVFLFPSPSTYTASWAVAAIVVSLLCVFVGWRSAKRVSMMHGLGSRERVLVSLVRPAWFSAWAMLIGLSIAGLVLLS